MKITLQAFIKELISAQGNKKKRIPPVFKVLLLVIILFFCGLPGFEKGEGFLSGQQASAGLSNQKNYSEEELAYLDFQITKLLVDKKFNGNVLIARHGMKLYERSFGFSTFEKSEPMNLETTFQLASISKTFTAAAILILQKEGKLDIEQPIKQYIEEFPYPTITIRHLLSHTSGVQNYMWLVERAWKKKELPNNEDVLQLFLKNPRPLNFVPGTKFEYSNTGYVFLGLLIERMSGLPYSEFIHTHIFDPLDMSRSFVYDLHYPRNIDNRAFGYRLSRGRHLIIPDDVLDGPLGDKGIFSTLNDLYKWDQALYRNELLSADEWQLAFTNARLSNDTIVDYGLGWRLQTFVGKRIIHHPGRWHGFRTSFKRFPDDRTTIIVLSNNNQSILEIVEGIQDIIYFEDKEIWMASQNAAPVEQDTELPESGF